MSQEERTTSVRLKPPKARAVHRVLNAPPMRHAARVYSVLRAVVLDAAVLFSPQQRSFAAKTRRLCPKCTVEKVAANVKTLYAHVSTSQPEGVVVLNETQ